MQGAEDDKDSDNKNGRIMCERDLFVYFKFEASDYRGAELVKQKIGLNIRHLDV
jgi:hypothetical protein